MISINLFHPHTYFSRRSREQNQWMQWGSQSIIGVRKSSLDAIKPMLIALAAAGLKNSGINKEAARDMMHAFTLRAYTAHLAFNRPKDR